MAKVVLTNVGKEYAGGVKAVHGTTLEIADREFVVLVGSSGSGKSTTLRMIAGLEEITHGTLQIGGRIVNAVAPKDRDIAMVFQNYALYPHMTCFENMAFGLQLRSFPTEEIKRRVDDAARILGIAELLGRRPSQLSGGQRQRVAVGRAIVRKPAVFLFDEPLSNLDAKLRAEMRVELKKLHQRLAATMIYVTHDQAEAMTLADRIVIMGKGEVLQAASPLNLYGQPVNMHVAGFIGSPAMNFLAGRLQDVPGGMAFTDGELLIPLPPECSARVAGRGGSGVFFGIRPEMISERAAARDWPHVFPLTARAEVVESLGDQKIVHFATAHNTFLAKLAAHAPVHTGSTLELAFNLGAIHLFDAQSGVNLTCAVGKYEAADESKLPRAQA